MDTSPEPYLPDHSLFDGYEMHPCTLSQNAQGEQWIDQCEEDYPNLAFWSVYGHLKTGGLECLSDHATKDEALSVLSKLEQAKT